MLALNKSKKAFTLIELLVVIAIIGVLAGAILYSADNARQRGRDQKRKEDLKSINSALVSYHTDNKVYPPSIGSQRDFASDVNPNNWIPDLSPYIEKLPKDPQQASNGSVAAQTTIRIPIDVDGADDFQIWHSEGTGHDAGAQRIVVGKTITGRVYKAGLRFPSINLDAGTDIINARLIFNPKNETTTDQTFNDSSNVHLEILTELNMPNPPQFTSYQDYMDRLVAAEDTSQILIWKNVAGWNPTPSDENLTSFNVTTLVQAEINSGSWQNGYPINFFVHPELDGVNAIQPGHGRVFHSFESSGDAPILEITYESNSTTPPPPPPPSSGSDRGSCDSKSDIYCLRVSDNRNAYVLWAKLENTNDRDLVTNSNAVCRISDPDFSIDPTNTSPFKDLGRPHNSTLNYCIKSTL